MGCERLSGEQTPGVARNAGKARRYERLPVRAAVSPASRGGSVGRQPGTARKVGRMCVELLASCEVRIKACSTAYKSRRRPDRACTSASLRIKACSTAYKSRHEVVELGAGGADTDQGLLDSLQVETRGHPGIKACSTAYKSRPQGGSTGARGGTGIKACSTAYKSRLMVVFPRLGLPRYSA